MGWEREREDEDLLDENLLVTLELTERLDAHENIHMTNSQLPVRATDAVSPTAAGAVVHPTISDHSSRAGQTEKASSLVSLAEDILNGTSSPRNSLKSKVQDEGLIVRGVVHVQVGSYVCISIGDAATTSRRRAFNELAIPLLQKGLLAGFDPDHHSLVIPKTPFKPNTDEHLPDKGAHVTVAMQGRHEHDIIGEDAMALDGRQVIVSFYSEPVFLEGE